MNRLLPTLGLTLLFPPLAWAGPLYGTIRIGPAPAAGVEVSVACPGFGRSPQPPSRGITDARGGFALRVLASGRCEMRARRGNQVGLPFDVFVSNNPLRLDFEVNAAMNRVR